MTITDTRFPTLIWLRKECVASRTWRYLENTLTIYCMKSCLQASLLVDHFPTNHTWVTEHSYNPYPLSTWLTSAVRRSVLLPWDYRWNCTCNEADLGRAINRLRLKATAQLIVPADRIAQLEIRLLFNPKFSQKHTHEQCIKKERKLRSASSKRTAMHV